MAEWLKGCEICDAGLCARVDELIGQGMSQRQAAKELEKDQEKELGEVLYSAEALRNRYQMKKGGRKSTTTEVKGKIPKPPIPYSCAKQMADLAIDHLGRIPKDDPKRQEAFNQVITWINKNSE